MNLKEYLRRIRVRKLAERCLTGQYIYSDDALQDEMVNNAIKTAEKFYNVWEGK